MRRIRVPKKGAEQAPTRPYTGSRTRLQSLQTQSHRITPTKTHQIEHIQGQNRVQEQLEDPEQVPDHIQDQNHSQDHEFPFEIPDSDVELGPIAIKRSVRHPSQAPNTYSFRKLRTKTFAQRHVYTVDLCKFLNLETEHEIERLSKESTDDQIMDYLNRIYLGKKDYYDHKGVKRHKFMKPTFQIYVEDFKKYESSGLGKSFYDTIQDESGSSKELEQRQDHKGEVGKSILKKKTVVPSLRLESKEKVRSSKLQTLPELDQKASSGTRKGKLSQTLNQDSNEEISNQTLNQNSIEEKSNQESLNTQSNTQSNTDLNTESLNIEINTPLPAKSAKSLARTMAHKLLASVFDFPSSDSLSQRSQQAATSPVPSSSPIRYRRQHTPPVPSSPIRAPHDSIALTTNDTNENSTKNSDSGSELRPEITSPAASRSNSALPTSPASREPSPHLELSLTAYQGPNESPDQSPRQETTIFQEAQPPHPQPVPFRSLRHRKFSQNHIYTVDLCAYLGLLTKTELDSFAESGKTDEEIFRKLDFLYEDKRKRYPHLSKAKFKFRSFLQHLEDHTRKYQRRMEVPIASDSFSSSQLVRNVSSDDADADADADDGNSEPDSDADSDADFLANERKRLKGVLPFSFLKLNLGSDLRHLKRKNARSYGLDMSGIAKRRVKKVRRQEDFGDFINDDAEELPMDPYDPYHIDTIGVVYSDKENEVSGANDMIDISANVSADSLESPIDVSSESDSDLHGYEFGASVSLFGMAEEDTLSGFDHMLNRASGRGSKSLSKPKSVKSTRRPTKSRSFRARNLGTSDWSTNSNRIYRRAGPGSGARQQRYYQRQPFDNPHQQRLPFNALDQVAGNETDLKTSRQKKSDGLYHSSASRSASTPSYRTNHEHKLTEQSPEPQQQKKKPTLQQKFYGISPNLSIHAISRAPQSFTPQLETASHKYKVVKQKNLSKNNLTPLEPLGIYRIPSPVERLEAEEEGDNDDVVEIIDTEKSIIELCGDLVELYKYQSSSPSLWTLFTGEHKLEPTDSLSWKFNGTEHRLNPGQSVMKTRKTIETNITEICNSIKAGNDNSEDIKGVFCKMIEWIDSKDVPMKSISDLIESFQNFKNTLTEFLLKDCISVKRPMPNKNLSIYIGWALLVLKNCLGKISKNEEIIGRISYICSSLIQVYLLYVCVCENARLMVRSMQSEKQLFNSFKVICNINQFLPSVSLWAESCVVIQRCLQLHVSRGKLVDVLEMMAGFTDKKQIQQPIWKPVTLLLKSTRKLIGLDQVSSIKRLLKLIFALQNHQWDLDESVVTSVYDLLSHARFKNFIGENGNDLSLTTGVSSNPDIYNENDTVLQSYFKFLSIYLAQRHETDSRASLVEKIMPISALDNDGMSLSVLVNRSNVLLVYSNLFRTSFLRQLSILYGDHNHEDSNQTLEIKFNTFVLLMQVHSNCNIKPPPMNSIRQVVFDVIEKFNMVLTVRLNLQTVRESSEYLSRMINKISGFFNDEGVDLVDLLKIVNELLHLKFHATSELSKILYSTIFLVRRSLRRLKEIPMGQDHSSLLMYVKSEFYDSVTRLLALQLSIFVPQQNDNYGVVNLLVSIWCELSEFLVARNLIDWNSVVFYHWNNIAGARQREVFELTLLEVILDNKSQAQGHESRGLDFNNDDIFFKLLSRHIVKFNSDRLYHFLKKLVSFNESHRFIFSNSFSNLESKAKFDHSRIQVVISYVYYLKQLCGESIADSKVAENLLLEMIDSLDREYDKQDRMVVNFNWFSHFASKIVKFINYSCFDLVKSSIEFSKLRRKLKISYHSDAGFAESFKLELMNTRSQSQKQFQLIESTLLSSMIQGDEATAKFAEILQSFVVEQMYNVYDKETALTAVTTSTSSNSNIEINDSSLFILTMGVVSHLYLFSEGTMTTATGVTHLCVTLNYLQILLGSILLKGSLQQMDVFCLLKMVRNIQVKDTMGDSNEMSEREVNEFNLVNVVKIRIFQLLDILYNLASGYLDQEKISDMILMFVNGTGGGDHYDNIYRDHLKVLSGQIPAAINDITEKIAQSQSELYVSNTLNMENTKRRLMRLIGVDLESECLDFD